MNTTTESSKALKRIFISYPHAPEAHAGLVNDVRQLLEQKGYAMWFDADEIKEGDDWRARIVEGLLETDFVLAFLSGHSMRDPGVCRNEISVALHEKGSDDLLMTAQLESDDKTRAPVTLAHIQPVDLTDFEAHYPKSREDAEAMTRWHRWLEEAIAQLVEKMENGKDVAGDMTVLRKKLQPASYTAEIAQKSAAFEGRQWLFEEIQSWQQRPEAARVFALQGSAGVGKSAISAHLSHYRETVFGVHFCKYNDVSTHSTNNLVRTMAFQLASRSREYRAKLIYALSDDKYSDDKLLTISGEALFDELIVALTQSLNVTDDEHKLFIVDGLDEATVRGDNAILKLVSDKFSALPTWLRVLVTSRPEAAIVEALPGSYVLNADDPRNLTDVESFLEKGLSRVPALADNEDALNRAVAVATEKSAGVMLYASELLRAVGEGYLDPLTPDEFPTGLGGLYLLSLRRHYPNTDQYDTGQPSVADLLELIAGSPMPITERLLTGIGNITDKQLTEILKPLQTLLVRKPKPGEQADTFELFHKSFADWLLEDHAYQLNGDGAKTIGEFLYQTYEGFEDACNPNSRVGGWLQQTGINVTEPNSIYLEDIYNLLPLCLSKMAIWNDTKNLDMLWDWFFKRLENGSLVPIKRSVEIKKDRYGDEHPDTLNSMHLLAVTLYRNDAVGARKLHAQVLAARRRVLGDDDPDTIVSMETFFHAHENLKKRSVELLYRGSYDGAKNILEELLELEKTAFGKEVPSSINNLTSIAMKLSEQGYGREARDIQKTLVLVHQHILGENEPDTLVSIRNFASLLFKQHDYYEARKMYEHVLAGYQLLFGEKNEITLMSMHDLASTLYKQGEYESARKMHEKVFSDRKSVLGERNLYTLLSMNSLASTHFKQGDYQEVQSYLAILLRELEPFTQQDPQFTSPYKELKTSFREAIHNGENLEVLFSHVLVYLEAIINYLIISQENNKAYK